MTPHGIPSCRRAAPRSRALTALACGTTLLLASAPIARAASAPTAVPAQHPQRIAMVPEVAQAPFALSSGKRAFVRRLSFSPGYGRLGGETLFVFRLAYNPNAWLGYEASIGHNPGQSVHALFNTFNVLLRYPLPGRVQPYGTLGYGMMMVFPGEVLNADPVTKNALAAGGGLELYVRNDLAVRGELRQTAVLGGGRNPGDTGTYSYGEVTVGLSFYRTLGQ